MSQIYVHLWDVARNIDAMKAIEEMVAAEIEAKVPALRTQVKAGELVRAARIDAEMEALGSVPRLIRAYAEKYAPHTA